MATTVQRWDSGQELERMRRELDESMRKLWPSAGGALAPPADVTKTSDAIVVKLDLPGLTVDDVQIEVLDRTLVVSGERREEVEENHEGYYSRERSFGRFARTFGLPPGVDTATVKASFDDGVLTIDVPLRAEAKPRRIPILSRAKQLVHPHHGDTDAS
jgi:HSP20 family protein